jgi:hypothetical protein
MTIVNASAGGLLVETPQRLLPGMPVDIHLERNNSTSLLRGRVLRCAVVRVTATAMCYRGAIGFDQHQSWLAEKSDAGISFPTRERQ